MKTLEYIPLQKAIGKVFKGYLNSDCEAELMMVFADTLDKKASYYTSVKLNVYPLHSTAEGVLTERKLDIWFTDFTQSQLHNIGFYLKEASFDDDAEKFVRNF